MKTIVTQFYFDSADGDLTIQIKRLPDNVLYTEHYPNPDDLPQDFIIALNLWTHGEQQ